MSSNVVILEGGRGARMNNTSVITTDTTTTGVHEWVPANERRQSSAYLTANGTFRAADEDLHSWNRVTVSVYGGGAFELDPLDPIEPVAPADITPITDEELLREIEANIPEELEDLIDELDELEDAIEELLEDTEDEELTNELQELLDDIADAETLDDVQDILDRAGEIDGLGDVVDKLSNRLEGIDTKDQQPRVDPSDASLYGVDENGGIVSVDKDGRSSDAVTGMYLYSSPSKLVYKDGDQIVFNGLDLALTNSKGRIVKVVSYPDSGIGTPVTVAALDGAMTEVKYDGMVFGFSSGYSCELSGSYGRGTDYFCFIHGDAIVRGSNNRAVSFICASRTGGSVVFAVTGLGWKKDEKGNKRYTGNDSYHENVVDLYQTYTVDGKKVYFGGYTAMYPSGVAKLSANGSGIPSGAAGMSEREIAWVMEYGATTAGGDRYSVQTVPVTYEQWSDSFFIWVRED